MIPEGFCQCGCGEVTSVAKVNDASRGAVKGVPARFKVGHNLRTENWIVPEEPDSPLCQCGCGEETAVATMNVAKRGWIKGRHIPYARGHHKSVNRGVLPDGVLIDGCDRELVQSYTWRIAGGYVVGTGYKVRGIKLHRLILGVTDDDPIHVDHINFNKLDNRRANLRRATPAINAQNRQNPERGVTERTTDDRGTKRWRARVGINGRRYHVGDFFTREEALEAVKQYRLTHSPGATC